VQIHCYQTEEYTVISVQDNGLGVKLPDTTKIFTMFERLHTHVEGTGIGLFMVKRIIENAGGKIEVESQLGKGSKFTIVIKN
jgi:signal transduction histidine kinase